MPLTFANVLTLIGVGCIFVIIIMLLMLFACAMGAWFVYRAKRDAYEPFIGGKGKGDAFTLPALDDEIEDGAEENIPESVLKRGMDLISQLTPGDKGNA